MVCLPLEVSGGDESTMLYVAKFAEGLSPVLVGAADTGRAVARVFELTGATPVVLEEVPDEMCCCEIRLAEDGEPDDDSNPADHTESGVALDPFDDFAAWLEAIDAEPLPAALAQTEPPATEPAPDGL